MLILPFLYVNQMSYNRKAHVFTFPTTIGHFWARIRHLWLWVWLWFAQILPILSWLSYIYGAVGRPIQSTVTNKLSFGSWNLWNTDESNTINLLAAKCNWALNILSNLIRDDPPIFTEPLLRSNETIGMNEISLEGKHMIFQMIWNKLPYFFQKYTNKQSVRTVLSST